MPAAYGHELQHLRVRLLLQANALYPEAHFSVSQAEYELLEDWEKDLLAVWNAFLDCKTEDLNKELDKLAVVRSFGERDTMALLNIHHVSRFDRRGADPQAIGLSRRKLLIAGRWGAPHHLVGELHDLAFYGRAAELWQSDSSDKASSRFACFRIAMLHGIMALRDWDLLDWIDALRQQALACREVVRLEDSTDEQRLLFAASAFRLLVFSGDIKDKEPSHASLANEMDRVAPEERSRLVRDFISLRPYLWDRVVSVLHLLSDAIPDDMLVSVAEWCVRYHRRPAKDMRGGRHDWMTFWGDILGRTGDTERLCAILHPIAMAMVGNAYMWKSDHSEWMGRYILSAPSCSVIEIVDRVFETVLGSKEFSEQNEDAWYAVYAAARKRPEIAGRYRRLLSERSSFQIQRLQCDVIETAVDKFVAVDDVKSRDWIRASIENEINNVLARTGAQFSFMCGVNQGLLGIVTWPEPERDLLSGLIRAINSPHIMPEEIGRFFLYLSELVSSNSSSHVPFVRDSFLAWIREIPSGHDPSRGSRGPFSPFRVNVPGQDYVFAALARFAATMCECDLKSVGDQTAKWMLTRYVHAPTKAAGLIICLAVILGVGSEILSEPQLEGIVLLTLHRTLIEEKRAVSVRPAAASLMSQIATLLDSNCKDRMSLSHCQDSERQDLVLSSLERTVPDFAAHSSADVRAATARVLANWRNSEIKWPSSFDHILETLRKDARARVRSELRSLNTEG